MNDRVNRQWTEAERPVGDLAMHHFGYREMPARIREGRLRGLVDLSEGFETLPGVLMGLFTGNNFGQRMVRLHPGEDPIW